MAVARPCARPAAACCSAQASTSSSPTVAAAACWVRRRAGAVASLHAASAALQHRLHRRPDALRLPRHAARGPRPVAAVKKTFTSFDDMIKESSVPVLVDFHAPWCGPCRLMSDSVAATAKELGPDVVRVVKVDTDAYPALATRFRVSALPTLVLFRGGAPVDRVEGYLAPAALADRVRYYCKGLDAKFGRR